MVSWWGASAVQRAFADQQQIEICRVISIAFMMTVHINPGSAQDSFVRAGAASAIGFVLIDVLGRASVAGLSFISGYLLYASVQRRSTSDLARAKTTSIVVPMLLWNSLFAFALAMQAYFSNHVGSAYEHLRSDWIAGLTAISGQPANESLFFLRDLFVSTILVVLARPAIRLAPIVVLAVVLACAILKVGAPLVFRPSVLVFLLGGYVYAQRGGSLSGWARWDVTVGAAVALLGFLSIVRVGDTGGHGISDISADLVKRGILTILFVSGAGAIAKTATGLALAPIGRHMFVTYLSHQLLFSVVWLAWTRLVGGPNEVSYLVYFLSMPILAIGVGCALGAFLDYTPPVVQLLVRGRAKRQVTPVSVTRGVTSI